MNKEQLIEELFSKGVLISKDLLNSSPQQDLTSTLLEKIEVESDLIVLNSDYVDVLKQSSSLVDWYEIDKYRVDAEKERNDELYQKQLQSLSTNKITLSTPTDSLVQSVSSLEVALDAPDGQSNFNSNSNPNTTSNSDLNISSNVLSSFQTTSPFLEALHATTVLVPAVESAVHYTSALAQTVQVIISYKNTPKKYTVADFTQFFLSRYTFMENILRHRAELQNLTTITRALQKKEKEQISIIGIIEEIGETKNGNMIISVEDKTAKLKVIISKSKKELYALGKELVPDEVVGISGTYMDKVMFGENIVWPDVPNDHELKKGPEEEYIIFLSDIHVGSKLFLKDEFNRFLKWLNGNSGNEAQRDMARKVKYIIIAGDLVDGVGIYPSQEDELEINDIKGQYTEFSRLLRQIPTDKQIIMCPGNHDMVYLAEPQPVFYQEFAPGLFDLPHVTLVTNPSLVTVGKKDGFSGFDILLYHGYSFDYYVANVESIRNGGGYHRSDLIMKFLLKRRHLAPSFRSTPYFPAHEEDSLIIKKIPDIFITGHIHYSSVANYKGITMISGSCWQGKTTFQEKLGHEPEPARVPIVNLQTREVKVLRFG